MRGHEPIVDMRRRGKKPAMVFIDAFETASQCWREWPARDLSMPQVEVPEDDALSGLDLRFVVGLRVMVTGHTARRVEAIRDLCIEAGASRVIAAVVDDHAAHITDTAHAQKEHRA